MKLYTAGTGNGQRAAIAVNECGVSCEIHVLNLGQGDQKAADYLKVNPTARIPTLIDPGGPGGKPLTVTQSWAILMYLVKDRSANLPFSSLAVMRATSASARSARQKHRLNQHGTRPYASTEEEGRETRFLDLEFPMAVAPPIEGGLF